MLKIVARGNTLWITGTFLGQRVRKTTGLPVGMEAEAQSVMLDVIRDMTATGGGSLAVIKARSPMTWDDAVSGYLTHNPKLTYSSKWCVSQATAKWHGVKLEQINSTKIKAWADTELIPRGRPTARKIVAMFSAVMHHAKAMGMLTDVPSISRPREKRAAKRALSLEQVTTLVNTAKTVAPDLYDMIRFLANTGARPIEAGRLKAADVVMPNAILRHRKGLGEWTERMVPLNSEARAAVTTAMVRAAKGEPLFGNVRENDESMASWFNVMFDRIVQAAGLPEWVKPYTLRHSFATNNLRLGTDIRTVQKLMGHTSIEQTAEYLQLADELMAVGVERLVRTS